MGKILVIGGANIDILGISSHHLISKDSNPGKIHVTFGGVGRNIAENCCNLKQNTIFVLFSFIYLVTFNVVLYFFV